MAMARSIHLIRCEWLGRRYLVELDLVCIWVLGLIVLSLDTKLVELIE